MSGFLESTMSLWQVLISVVTYCGSTVVLYFLAKTLWRWHVLKTAEDRTSPLTSRLPLPPGDFGFPLVGETISWALQGSKFNFLRRKKFGKIFSTHFLGNAMVKITGAENVRQILQGEHDTVTTIWPVTIRRILGEHTIANSLGTTHKHKRRLAMKGFSHSALNSYIPHIRKAIARRLQNWKESKSCTKIYPEILRMNFEVAAKAMAGIAFKSAREMEDIFSTFDEMIRNLFSLPYDMPFSGFRKGLKGRDIIHNLLDGHVRRKMKRLQSNANDGDADMEQQNDVMQYVIEGALAEQRKRSKCSDSESERSDSSDEEENKGLSIEDIKENIVELLFAGYLTTGSSISSILIQLAKHPDVREKVEQELKEHGLLHEDGMDIDLEQLQKLKYLEQVVKETLRVMPPILGGYRRALKTFQIGEYRIPKGWTIIYNIRDTHEYEFDDDAEFNPDRFSSENWSDSRENRSRWMPFGGGPRVCIGKDFARLQIKLTVIEMLRQFKSWEFKDGKIPPMFAVPTLHPTNGLPMNFTPR